MDLSKVADQALLKRVWRKEVRPALRALTFSNFNLAPDPLHYAAYEWGLETLVAALARDLRLGRYTPERGEVVRMAKGTGLSRPLCFLATRDALVYRSITSLCRDQLLKDAAAWVGFTHSDKGSKGEAPSHDAADSFDWFRFWLARQGHVLQMVEAEDVHFLVESDIANFFPSIRLEAIREHLHSQTDLEKEVVRLCIQIIDGVMPRQDYSEVSLMGLPQEQIGSSRDIAQSLLLHVDQEFKDEGARGRYTRYMDDILIGVSTISEGEYCISRLQKSLETIGLYPNAAKTVVNPVDHFLFEAMVDINAELDRLDMAAQTSLHGTPKTLTLEASMVEEIQTLSQSHREASPRPKRWNRVTRRIYTLHRKTGLQTWENHWLNDIREDPGAGASILEYVRSKPLTQSNLENLLTLSTEFSTLYPNISLLAAETVSSAPVADDQPLWTSIYEACSREFQRLVVLSATEPEADRLAAGWLLASWKYADAGRRPDLLDAMPGFVDAASPVRVQALPMLVAEQRSLSEWVAARPGLPWEYALAAEYLRSLQEGEARAVGVALSLLDPQLRLLPQRYAVLPRAVPLIPILGRSAQGRFSRSAPKILAKLQKNPEPLRDYKLEQILSAWCP